MLKVVTRYQGAALRNLSCRTFSSSIPPAQESIKATQKQAFGAYVESIDLANGVIDKSVVETVRQSLLTHRVIFNQS